MCKGNKGYAYAGASAACRSGLFALGEGEHVWVMPQSELGFLLAALRDSPLAVHALC